MLVGGILGYAFRANVALSMRTRMYSSLGEYGVNRVVTDAWDFTQSRVSYYLFYQRFLKLLNVNK